MWAHVPHRVGRLLMPLPRRRMGLSSDEHRALLEGAKAVRFFWSAVKYQPIPFTTPGLRSPDGTPAATFGGPMNKCEYFENGGKTALRALALPRRTWPLTRPRRIGRTVV